MPLLDQLAQTGVLGIILALAFTAIYFLYRENKTLQEARIKDAKQVSDIVTKPLSDMNATMVAILTILKNSNGDKL